MKKITEQERAPVNKKVEKVEKRGKKKQVVQDDAQDQADRINKISNEISQFKKLIISKLTHKTSI